jgi:hypothetical protein
MLAATSHLCACEPAPELLCSVCLDTWKDPVEIKPCAHIFCKECLGQLDRCPDCRVAIGSTKKPNRILCKLAEEIKVKCSGCGWSGTREESSKHRCFEAPQTSLPNTQMHEINPEVEAQLGAYFLAFGGRATDAGDDVCITKEGFFKLMKCFNYAETTTDLDHIYRGVCGKAAGDTVTTR